MKYGPAAAVLGCVNGEIVPRTTEKRLAEDGWRAEMVVVLPPHATGSGWFVAEVRRFELTSAALF